MIVKYLTLILFLTFGLGNHSSYCQNNIWNPSHSELNLPPHAQTFNNTHFCGEDHLSSQLYQQQPSFKQKQDSLEELWQRMMAEGHQFNSSRTIYTLPVVVHVVHNNGAGNISNAQVQAAIQNLNDAFMNVGYYNPATGIDTELRFCLAQRDPSGNNTNGITNTNSSLATLDMNLQDVALKSLIQWNSSNYINIWVVNEIIGGVAGYAYLPSAHGTNIDGIVIEKDFMGTSPANTAVLVHEMGHYFGLYHTFQGGCTNNNCTADGDQVCDTPPDNTTARPACGNSLNSCTTDSDDIAVNNPFRSTTLGGLGDQNDEIQNYMDYSQLICYDRFTTGQKDRMHFFLQGVRASLLSSFGCQSPCTQPINISFSANSTTITAGTTVNFTNTTTGAISYNWLVNNNSFATTANSSYQFNATGFYWVTLQAMNGDNNCTTKDSVQITVYCLPPCSEICDNGFDDTGDGLIDCFDPTCICNECSGKEKNIWYFGYHAGLDFNGGNPVSIPNGQTLSYEGTSVMNDANGNLLFYSDGIKVWNRTHAVMSNGSNLMGDTSSTHAALIVPHPGNPTLFYLFSTPSFENPALGIRYSIIDMSLNNGLGNVTATKNVLLFSNSTEKIMAVQHCNQKDFWIVAHEWNSNNFLIYELTELGLNITPTIQAVGSNHSGTTYNRIGYLKTSPDGKILATVQYNSGLIDILDFNNSTGVISSLKNITTTGGNTYGLEFSSDSRLLYVSLVGMPGKILQFDLISNNSAAIQASQVTIATQANYQSFGAVKRGPNGKIYIARSAYQSSRPFLAVIHNPNVLGLAANYQDSAIFLTPGVCRFGFPAFIEGTDIGNPNTPSLSGPTSLCLPAAANSTFSIQNYGCDIQEVIWTHLGSNSVTSTTDSSLVLNTAISGTDTIIVELIKKCSSTFDTLIVHTIINPDLDLGPDTSTCINGIISLNAGNGFETYHWQDGSQDPFYTVTETGLYWVECTTYCGTVFRDSVFVNIDTLGFVSFQDSSMFLGDTLTLNFNPGFNYQFFPTQYIDCSNCSNIRFYPDSTTIYNVVVSNGLGCFAVDSFTITVDIGSQTNTLNPNLDNTFKVYPNPAKEFIKISSSLDEIELVRIFDASGRLIDIREEINAKEIELSTRDYPNGILLIQVFGKTAQQTKKILLDN